MLFLSMAHLVGVFYSVFVALCQFKVVNNFVNGFLSEFIKIMNFCIYKLAILYMQSQNRIRDNFCQNEKNIVVSL